ncbi:hypothetical protein [Burkholderia cenocepacia]|uniref:hypothetical protein n=1 Tax=Burkholderia cenocepacia TaxID=95486 RepID=UPI002232BA65|nr:hypothetical protein [Burkholderia cenocepacia]
MRLPRNLEQYIIESAARYVKGNDALIGAGGGRRTQPDARQHHSSDDTVYIKSTKQTKHPMLLCQVGARAYRVRVNIKKRRRPVCTHDDRMCGVTRDSRRNFVPWFRGHSNGFPITGLFDSSGTPQSDCQTVPDSLPTTSRLWPSRTNACVAIPLDVIRRSGASRHDGRQYCSDIPADGPYGPAG